MTPRRPGTPEMGAREYGAWIEAVDAVDARVDQLRDAVDACALSDEQAGPFYAQLDALEELMVAANDHAEAAFKALAAALLPRPSVK